jgi:hypothetical protein
MLWNHDSQAHKRKGTVGGMDNLEQDELRMHEGREDDFDEDEGVMDENHPMWRSKRITLNSVGIDIGSSTSHLIFSRLTEGDSEKFRVRLTLLAYYTESVETE